MGFDISVEEGQDEATIKLSGELDAAVAPQFKDAIEKVAKNKPGRLVLLMHELEFMASAGLRVLIFARQKMGSGVSLYVVGSRGPVLNTLKMSGFHHSVYLQDTYAPE
ncbi:MAG: STAS domain-containing protein [Candidatus Thiodiazotropha sp. (ex Dulcina madagascariensis)]|nr:STAS domain-containing protein [Candidatus Thiodiazotropha sp. (ex Epidulcina cf. delphinae)]MCU7923548.1 STAS domain-containing protein [Candidatus Thiodiazotropha sp. (ex Dulcina madagascariensis)]MCU7927161.1 STAS domain-containing protein [Candidatus Thiodiazotropha sp. (ex Dulcina madagascariensis)]MCU7936601.1 STAS domain-containing protein [Candidatus Thiodiazotropha sp. (ex Dulcina madagascariensis)]